MKTMNQKDKVEFLSKLLQNGECYRAQIWGVIMADSKTIKGIGALSAIIGSSAAALGALSNEYCYIGVTDTSINFVVIEKLNVSVIKACFKILISDIVSVKIKKSILPGRKVLKIKLGSGDMKLSLVSNAIGSDLKDQKEGIEYLCDKLQNIG